MKKDNTKDLPQLIIAGSIAIDRIMNFSGSFAEVIKPEKLHVLSLSFLLNELVDTHGGTGANIAYSLALLGENPVLLSSIGNNGSEYQRKLKNDGVNTQFMHVSDLPTATFTVLTDEKDCQVGGFYPGAMVDHGIASIDAVVAELSSELKRDVEPFVVISAHAPELMSRQVAECREGQYRMCFDIGQQVSNAPEKLLQDGLEATELLILNDYEMEVFQQKTKHSLEEIISKVMTVVVTLGEKGCDVFSGSLESKQHVDAIPDVNVIDPTGAGDAFRAGFLYGYIRDWELEKCAQLGSVTASFAIEKKGTQEHHFNGEFIAAVFEGNYQYVEPLEL